MRIFESVPLSSDLPLFVYVLIIKINSSTMVIFHVHPIYLWPIKNNSKTWCQDKIALLHLDLGIFP